MREPAFWHRPASWTSHLLTPLAALYGTIAARRMQRPGTAADVPVFCIGNYHVGGAGKTPTVLALAKLLRELDERPVVLSRGYGGALSGPVKVDPASHTAADVGDEPLMMAATLPVVVSRDRAAGLPLASAQDASVILMDDGFQNPSVAKDASLIVIDAARGIGNGRVIPAGPLRAPLPPQLSRTDALIVVSEGRAAQAIAAEIRSRGKPVLSAHLKPDEASLAALHGKRVLAFAGIGDPARFFNTLRSSGVDVVRNKAFADHHAFTKGEIDALLAEARRDGLTLVTTEKDLARLRSAGGLPAWAQAIVPFAVTLQFEDADALRRLVTDQLFKARERRARRST
ncbi:tetraacyldisaccharide 4'-kinase [Bradyrhizobium ivorense]|uniref:tetraacyldisaccharide 4'-kinase n=1 Tax=Bradyrhizobium ivorense TaxID=2511166 RepID=UPI0010BB79C3|nr:tetraacyldisaccharide 4'-kinase [Bradyrhizobium ivorense]VIO68849.1 Tetraacyldisaccharide 4'-kinase [Bradyrhizobium ivorense]